MRTEIGRQESSESRYNLLRLIRSYKKTGIVLACGLSFVSGIAVGSHLSRPPAPISVGTPNYDNFCKTFSGVLAYPDANYQGSPVAFTRDSEDLRADRINDSISSLEICGDEPLTVEVFRHTDFKGESVVLKTSVPDFINAVGNDQASSLRISK